jgi:hypothetical protein
MRKFYLALILQIATFNLFGQLTLTLETSDVVATPFVLTPGATSQALFAIQLNKPSTASVIDVTSITIHFSSNPTGKFTNPQIWRSNNNNLDGGDTPFSGSFSGNTVVFTSAPLTNFGSATTAASTNRWFYFTVDIVAGAAGTETLSISDADIGATLSTTSTSLSYPTTTPFTYNFLTTSIASLNSPSNNVALSPLVASSTGQAVFGFSLTSGSSQTITAANVQLSSDPTGKLGTFSLVRSTDSDFATTGDNTTIGGLTFTPSATQVAITGLNEAITSTSKNYFLIANVNGAVTGATPSITASLAAANITASTGSTSGTATGTAYLFTPITATIASLNSPANNVAGTPLIASATGQAVFGFSLTSNGSQTATIVNVQMSSDPAGKLLTYSLVRSTDSDFATTGDNTTIGGLTFTPTATQIGITGLSEALTTTTKNYFLVANVNSAVTAATPSITASLASANVTVSTGVVSGSSTGTAYSFTEITTTIASLNTGANNIALSPLTANATGKGIFGFSLSSTGSQTVSVVNIQLTSDPTSKLSTFSLVRSIDADFATIGDNTTIGGLTFTPTATQVGITGLTEAISGTAKNYFLVTNIDPGVTGATATIQPSLAAANVTVNTGIVSGSSSGTTYSFQSLTSTVTGSGGTINLVGGATTQSILSFTVVSNGSQSLDALDLVFSTDISTVFNTSNFVFKNGAATVGTPSYNSGTNTLTITGINVNLATSQGFTLMGDVLSSAATSSQTLSLATAGVTVTGGGTVTAFTTITNTLSVTALKTTVTASSSAIGLIGGSTNQSIFTLSAVSNGSQSLSALDLVFSVDISSIFNTSSFVFKNGAATVGTPSYNAGTNTLTITGINVSLATSQGFTLTGDVLASAATSSQTLSLSTAGVTVTGGGTVNAFTTAVKTLNVTALATTVTASSGTISMVGGATNQSIFTLTAVSNGNQSMGQLDFVFSVDISTIFNTSSFVFKNGAATVGTPSYNAGTNTLTVSGIGVNLGTSQGFTLLADVLSSAPASSQTLSLSTGGVTVTGGGSVNAFTTATKTLNITGLAATLSEITAGTTPVMASTVLSAGATTRVLTGFSVSSSGTQQITAINFNISGLGSQLTNVALYKSSSAGSVGSSIATNAAGNFTGLTENVSTTVYYYLVADISNTVTSAAASITVAPTEANVTFSSGSKNTLAISRTFTFNSSQLSTITLNGGTSATIDYTLFLDAGDNDIDNTTDSKNIATLRINDPADADNLGTTLTDLTLTIGNYANLDRISLFDGNSGSNSEITIADQSVTSGTVVFSGLSLTAGDGSTKDFTVRVSFKTAVTDNDIVQVTVASATAANTGSGFAAANAGGATTGGATNKVIVSTSKLIFVDPLNLPPAGSLYRGPISATPNGNLGSTFSATAWTVDAYNNHNVDDNSSSITLNVSGGAGSLTSVANMTASAGVAFFNNSLSVTLAGTYNLNATSIGLTSADAANNSSIILNITSLGVTISKANLSACQVGTKNNFTALTSLTMTETDPSDFTPGTNLTFLMILPSGWEYLTPSTSSPTPAYSAPTISFTPSKNITAASFSGFIGTNIAKFIYSATNTNQSDALTISGLYVKNVSGTTSDIFRSGTGVIEGADDSKSLGTLTPSSGLVADFTVESQPGQSFIDPATTQFGVANPSVILNGQVGGNPVPVSDGVFTGNGVSLKTIGNPINADRYIFSPTAVSAGTTPVTLTYSNPTTGCISTVTKPFKVQDLAINGLQDEFCINDINIYNLSVDPTDIPPGYDLHDFVYYDQDFASSTLSLNNTANTATTEVLFYSSGVPTALTLPTPVYITDITINPFNSTYVYDYYGYYGGGPIFSPITNPIQYAYLYTPTSFVKLTIPSHGFVVNDKILTGNLDYIYPYFSNQEFTVYQVIDANNIIINIGEPYTGNPASDYGYTEWYLYYSAPYNTPVYKKQSLDPIVDFKIPGHGFVTGDRISVQGFNNFSPSINYNTYTVQVINANQIRIDITEVYPGTTVIRGNWQGQTFDITADPFIPLPGYIYDPIQPFPHKGAARSATSNTQFIPNNFSSNWRYTYVQVFDRMLPSSCAGVPGGAGCALRIEHYVPVQLKTPPTVDFTGLSSYYCNTTPPSPITLTEVNNLDGTFSGPGITDGGASNPTATFNPIGLPLETSQNITFTYSNGCTGTMTKQVVVHSLPTVDAGTGAAICNGTSVQIGGAPTATGNGNLSYQWDNAGSLDDFKIPNPKAFPNSNTTFTVTVTDGFGCSKTDNAVVTVSPEPIVDAGTTTPICSSNSVLNVTTIGANYSGSASSATWSTSGDGQFTDTFGAANVNFGTTERYVFGPNDYANGGVTLTLTTNDPVGPCGAVSDFVLVKINPAAIASPGSDQKVCGNQTTISFIGGVTGSATTGTWTTSGASSIINSTITNGTSTTSYYSPTATELLGSTITFTLTTDDPAGTCNADSKMMTVQIYGRPTVNAGIDQLVCPGDVNLNGTLPAGSTTTSTTWSFTSSSLTPGSITAPGTLVTTYKPDVSETTSASQPSQTDLIFTLTSNTPAFPSPCLAEIASIKVTLYPTPPPPISGGDPQYCFNDQIKDLTASGTISGSTINWYKNTFPSTRLFVGLSYPPTGVSNVVDKQTDFFATQTAYSNSTQSFAGCEGTPTHIILTVNPLPLPDFSVDKFCFKDFMEFTDLTTIDKTTNPARDLQSWQWDFADGDVLLNGTGSILAGTHNNRTINTYQNPKHQYQNTGNNYNVKLTVTSNQGCVNSIFANQIASNPIYPNQALRVGPVPNANFKFNFICDSDNTKFNYTGTIPGAISTWNWDFGDTGSASTQNPTHKYATVNNYPVSLIVNTDLNCADTVSKAVSILPYISTFPYIEDFESPSHGWFTEGLNTNGLTSWQLTQPAGATINSASDGIKAWYTHVDSLGTYFNNERSVLNGPCIDVTKLPRPAVSFDYWDDTDSKNDGTYMEVSKDQGLSWERLGNIGQGLNWYDQGLIRGLTTQNGIGQDVGQFGWSGNTTGWTKGKLSLEDYKSETKLRIRFVFGSNPDKDLIDGFAMDHFKLDSLNRVVLIENFTSETETANNDAYVAFKSDLTTNEIVKIQYHTGLKGVDDIYKDNKTDPNARVAYYGITNSDQFFPRGYLDGFSSGNFTTAWATNYFSTHSLEDAPFSLTVSTVPGDPGSLSISVSCTALDNIPALAKPVLQVVVIEKLVGVDEYVVRKMLPSPTGTMLSTPIAINHTDTYAMTWHVDNTNIDVSQLAVVAFVQDLGTKKVYQTKINLNPNNLPTVITGVEGELVKGVKIYPSPADQSVTIELPVAVKNQTPIKMFDIAGHEVIQKNLAKGDRTAILNTKDLAAGVYLIYIEEKEKVTQKKLVIIHEEE